jgi:hypothetical protein
VVKAVLLQDQVLLRPTVNLLLAVLLVHLLVPCLQPQQHLHLLSKQ